MLQFHIKTNPNKPAKSLEKLETKLSKRIRQDIMVKRFTRVFDASINPYGKFDMMERVGHCGDEHESVESRFGREVIKVPIATPDFFIERRLGYASGVMGANFLVMCRNKKALEQVDEKALKAIHEVEGVITPFDVCSAPSKPGGKFPLIGPTTNDPYCPSLKDELGKASKVPKGIKYISEIVINGTSTDAVKAAMKNGIEAAYYINGVDYITAVNFDGKLGKYQINLHDLFC